MALGGEMFTAEEARASDWWMRSHRPERSLDAAREYAGRIAKRGPAALEICKLMIASANGEDNGTAVEALGFDPGGQDRRHEGRRCGFCRKRPAKFKGEW